MPLTNANDGKYKDSSQDKLTLHNQKASQQSDVELQRLLEEGVSLSQETVLPQSQPYTHKDEDEDDEVPTEGDLQGALGLFAEAAQDMATSGVELGLGRHFACADFCNQAAEKATQSVSLLRFGHRSMYNHDLRALGILVGAPEEILEELAILTPFHPEAFHAETPPEEADDVINADQARSYIQSARHVLRWARTLVLNA
jgi:HEPN domain-containing protein